MTDQIWIKRIESWLDTYEGKCNSVAPDVRFLLHYIEEMELPVSTGRREIKRLQVEIQSLHNRIELLNESREAKDRCKDDIKKFIAVGLEKIINPTLKYHKSQSVMLGRMISTMRADARDLKEEL